MSEGTPRRRPRIAGVIGFLLGFGALLALVASLSLDKSSDKPVEITGAGQVQQLMGGIQQDGARLGSPDAPVTIDFFNDLQCSFCQDYQLDVVPPLVEDLVRPGKAALVYRHFPLGDKASELSDFGALAAAEQDYQWQFVQLFFINQDEVPAKGVDQDYLERIAAAVLEMDQDKWRTDYEKIVVDAEGALPKELDDDSQLEIDLRLPAEPAVVVTGERGVRKLEQQPSLDEIEAAVAEVSSEISRRTAIVIAAVATVILMVVLLRLDQTMADEGGHGIVAFEFAGSENDAVQIADDWGADGRDAARASLWIDYLYLIAYGALGALASLAVRDAAERRGWLRMAATGRHAAVAAIAAACFDALEDAGLLLALGGHGGDAAPLIATVCACFKFALIAFVIAYLLAGLILRLRQGPAPA